MKAKDLMTSDPTVCRPETRLPEVARMMCEEDCGAIPVVDAQGKPLGVVTDRDIVCRVIAKGSDAQQTQVRDCMTPDPVTASSEASIDEVCELLEQSQIRRLLIVDESGACCGIVSQADVALHAGERKAGEMVKEVSRERGSSQRPVVR
jgi:CBS domain-containing protein